MTDGPLIVQSDKTLLLEVDHDQAEACRRAIAPFAELERSPEHVHTYRLTPLGLWNARAAGHDAEQVVDALLTYSRYPVPHALLVDVAETMARYGRLRLESDPVHGLVLHTHRPGGARGGAAVASGSGRWSATGSTTTPSPCTQSERGTPQAGAAQARLAGRGPRRLRRRRGAPDRAGRGRLVAAALPARGGRGLLARRLRRRRAAVRRRQDPGRRRRDGPGQGHDADPGHQHRRRPAVARRAAAPDQRSPRTRSASTPAPRRRSGRSPSRPTRS